MKNSDLIPEQIDDDEFLAPLKQKFLMEPPANLERRVKQSYLNSIAEQHKPSIKGSWYQQLLLYWQLVRQAPAVAASLLVASLLIGGISGLSMPSPWRTEQQSLLPANTSMVLRNGNAATSEQAKAIAENAQLPPEIWRAKITVLIVQQREKEALIQLQAYIQHYSQKADR